MALGIIAALCFAIASALLVRMHLLSTGLDPVRDAVSDYGTTSHHRWYRAMVVAFGVGALLLAIGLARETDAGELVWLWVYGPSRIAIAGFMTDYESPPTSEGRIHLALATIAFASIAVAGVTVRWSGAPGALDPLGYALGATALGTLLTRVIPSLRRVFGLVERLLYLATIGWLLTASIAFAAG